ncbi:MAG: hypothetical protein HYU33_03355 [Candidatus Omnitrophica bacterium]|nr:hypothetical protein [Candidatus Omnitrophota bacterium]
MRKITAACAILLFCVIGLAQAEETTSSPDHKNTAFQTAIVVYHLSGDTEGTRRLFIESDRVAVEQQLTKWPPAFPFNRNRFQLEDSSGIYDIDLDRRTGTKRSKQSSHRQAMKDYFEESVLEFYGSKVRPTGNKEVAGVQCDAYEGSSITGSGLRIHCFHRGLLVQQEIQEQVGPHRIREVLEAVEVQFDVPIPETKFQLPDGIEIEE